MSNRTTPSAHVIRAIAVAGLVSPRAVVRLLRGEPTKALTRTRVERAARELGIDLDRLLVRP
jgi:DNA-binding LacI/PurR family transcriptional regulator